MLISNNLKTIKKSKNLNIYLVIFISAFIFRWLMDYLNFFNIDIITSDSIEYLNIAKSLKYFGVYGLDGVQDMNRTPLYPFFIFFTDFIFGSNIKNIVFFQIFLDSLNCCFIFYIAEKYKIKNFFKFILLVLIITCLYTSSYSLMIMTETLYSFLITLCLFFLSFKDKLSKFFFDFKYSSLFFIALVMVLIVLTRPIFVLTLMFFIFLCFLYIIFFEFKKFRLNLLKVITLGLFMTLLISPWSIRNILTFKDDIFSKNSIATPLGYKTNYNMWKHFYLKEFKLFLKSYEEPFLMLAPNQPPKFAKYIYEGEKKDIQIAFEVLNKTPDINGKSGKQLEFSEEVKEKFKLIAEKRDEKKQILHITAPVSRILKLLFAPRLSTFSSKESGFNSSKIKLITFMFYNFIYIFMALVFFLFRKNFEINRVSYIFIFSALASHIYAYTIWIPAPQSRYIIPLFPIFSLLTSISLDRVYKLIKER